MGLTLPFDNARLARGPAGRGHADWGTGKRQLARPELRRVKASVKVRAPAFASRSRWNAICTGCMSTDIYRRLLNLLPAQPLQVGMIDAIYPDGSARVLLLGGAGGCGYQPGLAGARAALCAAIRLWAVRPPAAYEGEI